MSDLEKTEDLTATLAESLISVENLPAVVASATARLFAIPQGVQESWSQDIHENLNKFCIVVMGDLYNKLEWKLNEWAAMSACFRK
ncbi:hypothetical protein HYALB_00004614 [Hymenoscyphus albidus]|uniref:Uncharacterized protein n=1 Tax=Hymenoscyphus albidus TaxID=595503 RepID=A0A9N9QCX5_9HELO|nr:hypothetical protein HYALB_00004614 [Hymenoscyphus albidus]